MRFLHTIFAWLRWALLAEYDWCFTSPDASTDVLARIKSEVREIGPMKDDRDWSKVPHDDVIYGHASEERLQLSLNRVPPLTVGSLFVLWFLMPMMSWDAFYFDGRIRRLPKGCVIRGSYRRYGISRFSTMIVLAVGLAPAFYWANYWAKVVQSASKYSNGEDIHRAIWESLLADIAIVSLFVALPILFIGMLIAIVRGLSGGDLYEREELYEFLQKKARPD